MKKVLTSFIIVVILFFVFLGFLLIPIRSYNFSGSKGEKIFKIKIPLLYFTSTSQSKNLLQIGVEKADGNNVLNFVYDSGENVSDCNSLFKLRFGDISGSETGFSEKKVGAQSLCVFNLEKDLYKKSTFGYLILPQGKGVVSVLYPNNKKSLAEIMLKTIEF